jgi:hypothetical protein
MILYIATHYAPSSPSPSHFTCLCVSLLGPSALPPTHRPKVHVKFLLISSFIQNVDSAAGRTAGHISTGTEGRDRYSLTGTHARAGTHRLITYHAYANMHSRDEYFMDVFILVSLVGGIDDYPGS